MHLKRTAEEEKKNTIGEQSVASNEPECQQRVGTLSLCLSPSQDGLKNLDKKGERERSDLTANDAKPLFKASPAAQA